MKSQNSKKQNNSANPQNKYKVLNAVGNYLEKNPLNTVTKLRMAAVSKDLPNSMKKSIQVSKGEMVFSHLLRMLDWIQIETLYFSGNTDFSFQFNISADVVFELQIELYKQMFNQTLEQAIQVRIPIFKKELLLDKKKQNAAQNNSQNLMTEMKWNEGESPKNMIGFLNKIVQMIEKGDKQNAFTSKTCILDKYVFEDRTKLKNYIDSVRKISQMLCINKDQFPKVLIKATQELLPDGTFKDTQLTLL